MAFSKQAYVTKSQLANPEYCWETLATPLSTCGRDLETCGYILHNSAGQIPRYATHPDRTYSLRHQPFLPPDTPDPSLLYVMKCSIRTQDISALLSTTQSSYKLYLTKHWMTKIKSFQVSILTINHMIYLDFEYCT